MYILGISAFYHDSAASLICNNNIIAAAQEERFTRKKHDAGFPTYAIQYCLDEAGICLEDIEIIAFYDKPFLKFERILETYYDYAPKGITSFLKAMPVWLKEKLFLKQIIKKELLVFEDKKVINKINFLFPEHHLSHIASAFYPSPFQEAAFITLDGVGEYATTTFGYGKNEEITMLGHIDFPHSLGLLYSAFTYYTGFKVNSGEYKLMGLAPYGKPKFTKLIYDHLITVQEDGSFQLNMKYFDYATGLRMTSKYFDDLFGRKPRKQEDKITQHEMDIAASIQKVCEDIVIKIAQYVRNETNQKNLVLAGGVALNCVANGRLRKKEIFENIWIQPAAGDAGGSLGAALSAYHIFKKQPRIINPNIRDAMQGALLGPSYENKDVDKLVQKYKAVAFKYENFDDLSLKISKLLSEGKIVAWFQGRMEFGPRALGNRSILGDARNPEMQKIMNLKIKFRESFRPFAPIVLEEDVDKYFDYSGESPYMLMVANILKERQIQVDNQDVFGIDALNLQRSDIPAVTHVDYSARLQTVDKIRNPRLYQLLTDFKKITGYSVLVNTSFNVRGEPIVNTPEDAYICFMRTNIDYLVINDYIFEKTEQDKLIDDGKWQQEFELD